jgi:hypothetical protein
MKSLILLIGILIITTLETKAQSDSVVCLPKRDVLTLANKIQLLKDSLVYKGHIISAQDTLINTHNERSLVFKSQLENRQNAINTLENENKNLREAVDLLMPKWYDNKWLWFGGGVASAIIAVILVN